MDLKGRGMGLRLRWGEKEERIGSRLHLFVVGFLGLLKIQRRKAHGVACLGRAEQVASLDFRRTA